MLSRLLTKNYIFGFVVLLGAILMILFQNAGLGSPMLSMALRLLVGALLIVVFFDLLRLGLVDEKTSYRSMLMERPLFNPRGKKGELEMLYPLHPKFITVYFDHEEENPYETTVYSIQALRYEYGYFSDALFLPLKTGDEPTRGKLLTIEEALRLLTAYTEGFPLVVFARDYSSVWLRETTNSVLLTDAISTQDIARVIYPKLTDYGIEDINDWLRFEVDEDDPVYGAKITAAIYLDYLRLQDYDTTITMSPLGKEADLEPIFPEKVKAMAAIKTTPPQERTFEKEVPTTAGDVPLDQETLKERGAQPSTLRYIGPFTPIDENGFTIPERGHLVAKEDE